MPPTRSVPVKISDLTSQAAWTDFIKQNDEQNAYIPKGGPLACKASASEVFAVLTNSRTWKEWSSLVPEIEVKHSSPHPASTPGASAKPQIGKEIEGDLKPGAVMDWRLVMDPKKPENLAASRLVVDAVLLPEKAGESFYITWHQVSIPEWIHSGRRVWKIEDLPSGEGSRIMTWDYLNGPILWLVKMLYGARLDTAMEMSVNELKDYCERHHNGAK